jgi:glycolate oxidase FAD binding subunit
LIVARHLMADRKNELARLIRSIVGDEHVNTEHINIERAAGFDGALLVKPGSANEVAQTLSVAAELNAAVIPAGLGTWLDCGNPVRRADVVLSLDRMSRIIEYSPADLTATIEAGLTLSEFNVAANRERQWLPLDPPGFAAASLGAIAACNSSGALRAGFGTPRDYVLGLKLAHADGSQSKSGGRVVKNVAGYDMNKLYVGSFGTLAVLTELTVKLRPLPEATTTLIVSSESRDSLLQFAKRVASSELQPASIFITSRLMKPLTGSSTCEDALLIRFIESEAAVKHQSGWIERALERGQTLAALDRSSDGVWKLVADLDRRASSAVKISVPLSSARSVYERMVMAVPGCIAAADLATGIIRMAFDSEEGSLPDLIKGLRAAAEAAGGSLFIERATGAVRRRIDAWGEVKATASLMRSIKDKLDPQSLLNPGRFAAGI